MPRTAAKFTQAGIARALRAVKDSGMELAVEVAPDGTIRIVPFSLNQAATPRRFDGKKEIRL